MSANIHEVQTGTIAASGSTSPTTATTLQATDLVVVTLAKAGTSGVPTITGGGVWNPVHVNGSSKDAYAWMLTGATTAITPTITTGSVAADFVLYVLRSSTNSTVRLFDATIAIATVTAGVEYSVRDIWATGDMVALAVAVSLSGTVTAPSASSAPAAGGWVADYTGANSGAKFFSYNLSADSLVDPYMSNSASTNLILGRALFGDGDEIAVTKADISVVVAQADASTGFIGWGTPMSM